MGPASDVFSLGCVIVFAATGTGPFGNGPQASLLYRVVHAVPAVTEVPGGLRNSRWDVWPRCLLTVRAGGAGVGDRGGPGS